MAPIIRAVRAKKATNRALQRGYSLSGTLQEGLFTGSGVLNEVVLEYGSLMLDFRFTDFSEVRLEVGLRSSR